MYLAQALNIISYKSNSLMNEEKLRNFMIENNILLSKDFCICNNLLI